jgi:hypothetical protein
MRSEARVLHCSMPALRWRLTFDGFLFPDALLPTPNPTDVWLRRRILNSTMRDVRERRFKVDVLGDAVERTELGTEVIRFRKKLWHPDVIRTVAQCDLVIGGMDTVDGRYLPNALASYYTIPYLDIGVRLDAVRDGANKGRIREVCGTVNYLRPGRSSLMSRGLFTMADVAAAGLRRNDPAAHARQVEDGYIKGVAANRPAVISVNMFAASLAVNEFLARLHAFFLASADMAKVGDV